MQHHFPVAASFVTRTLTYFRHWQEFAMPFILEGKIKTCTNIPTKAGDPSFNGVSCLPRDIVCGMRELFLAYCEPSDKLLVSMVKRLSVNHPDVLFLHPLAL